MIKTKYPARIRCSLRDSGNVPVEGAWLRVTADSLIAGVHDSPKVLITRQPRKFMAVDGIIDIELINSEDSGVTYLFETGYTEDYTTPPVPPLTTPTTAQRDIITGSFRAVVPRPVVASSGVIPIDLSDLIPSGISLGSLDASVLRVADLIVSSPVLRTRAVQQFNIKGPYQAGVSYQYGDLVTISTPSAQTHVCTSSSPTAPAALPLDPDIWLRLL